MVVSESIISVNYANTYLNQCNTVRNLQSRPIYNYHKIAKFHYVNILDNHLQTDTIFKNPQK